jgi:hypothetical protein
LVNAIVEALRNAGATEEIVTALLDAGGAFDGAPRSKGGRPRKHVDRPSKDRAYPERKKARDETRDEIGRAECRAGRLGDETRDETPAVQVPRDETRDETSQVPPSASRNSSRNSGGRRSAGTCLWRAPKAGWLLYYR